MKTKSPTTRKKRRFSRAIRTVAAFVLTTAIAAAVACGTTEKPRGQIMIAIQTDMPLPQEVDSVRVEVLVNGELRFGNDYPVGAQYTRIPATVGVVFADQDASSPVTIRVIGKRKGVVRTLREAVTTIPKDRLATLRMPIQWLCDESAKKTPAGTETATSACPNPSDTCQAGACVPNDTPAPSLPTYTPPEVFNGAPDDEKGTTGQCFDTVPCMLLGVSIVPDANCKFPLPAGDRVNVALRVPKGGICDPNETSCFVPLDARTKDGWEEEGGMVKLPAAACQRLTDGRVRGVVVSTACETKTPKVPTCGPWSSVESPVAGTPDAGTAIAPSLVANIPAGAGNDSSVRCGLMQLGTELITCVGRTSTPDDVSIVALKPETAAVRTIANVRLTSQRGVIPAAIDGSNLYFLDRDVAAGTKQILKRMDLTSGNAVPVGPAFLADAHDESSLLVDGTSVYALAGDIVVGDAGGAKQFAVIKLDKQNAATTILPMGSTNGNLQFTQDADAIYVVAVTDSGNPPEKFARTSQIKKIPKNGGPVAVAAPVVVETNSLSRGGFIGLRIVGTNLYATQDGTLNADGTYNSSFVRFNLADLNAPPTVLLTQLLKASESENRLLGSSGASSLFVFQRQLGPPPSPNLAASQVTSISILPLAGGNSRPVADFVDDSPSSAASGIVEDPVYVFWMNRSGRVFKYPRPQ